MKQKGFTLIELLAVIVVLAIIALIATPLVLNTIDEARKGAAKSSAHSYVSAIETSLATYMLSHNGNMYSAGKYNVSTLKTDLKVELKGDAPTEGNVCIGSNGVVEKASVKINGYVISYNGNETTTTDLKEIEDITCSSSSNSENENVTYASYTTGTEPSVIYFNPAANSFCTETDYINNADKLGTTGCLKWYAIENSDATKPTVNVILNHNTPEALGSFDMDVYVNDLKTNSGWQMDARFMTISEALTILGIDPESFDGNDPGWSNCKSLTAYPWLYSNLTSCSTYGCLENDSYTSERDGYYLEQSGFQVTWYIRYTGYLTNLTEDDTGSIHPRPVITINKPIL